MYAELARAPVPNVSLGYGHAYAAGLTVTIILYAGCGAA